MGGGVLSEKNSAWSLNKAQGVWFHSFIFDDILANIESFDKLNNFDLFLNAMFLYSTFLYVFQTPIVLVPCVPSYTLSSLRYPAVVA